MKDNKDKEKLLEALKENHIVLIACKRAGISKSAYYRFRKSDSKFAKKADEAIQEGVSLVNDAAEGTVVGAIKDRSLDAAKFWLKHRHPDFNDSIFKAGIAITNNGDEDNILEVFAELKPKTREMLEPYLGKNIKGKNNGHGKTK